MWWDWTTLGLGAYWNGLDRVSAGLSTVKSYTKRVAARAEGQNFAAPGAVDRLGHQSPLAADDGEARAEGAAVHAHNVDQN